MHIVQSCAKFCGVPSNSGFVKMDLGSIEPSEKSSDWSSKAGSGVLGFGIGMVATSPRMVYALFVAASFEVKK